MSSMQSYQLQKINDEIILNRIWKNYGNAAKVRQVKLCSLELMKLRKYLHDKKINCFTCNKTNLNFEEGYVDCFRNNKHHIEIIDDNPHLFCKLLGYSSNSGKSSQYQNYYYCSICKLLFKKTEIRCPCCGLMLRHDTNVKIQMGRKLLRK